MNNTVLTGGLRALCCSIVLALARAQAADLYVSTQGSDSNPGTSSAPFNSITYAYSRASAGTTIHVLPGVYYDYTSGWGIHLGKSGSASSPIVLHSETRGAAVIDGQNASGRNEGFYIDGSYNTVDGFEIRYCPSGGIAIYGNGNRIINNHIHNNGNPASSSTNGRDGAYSNPGTSGNYYGGNYIHDNGRAGSNLDHGLYLCGQNEMIINNILMHNAACGLQVAGYTTVSNMKVYNNVIAWNGTDGIILWQSLSGVDIRNNILFNNGHYGLGSYAATGGGVVVDHNLFFGNVYNSYDFKGGGSTYSYTLGTVVSSDPHFANVSVSSFDAHLSAGSPAIQAGLNLYSTVTTDMSGAPRPSSGAWDLGVYVYGAVAGTPPPASGLTFGSTSGTISAPFVVANNAISQPAYTGLATSGQAFYPFRITAAGNYVVTAMVNAPSTDNNSLFVNIDAQPSDPVMIWDVPVTSGFATRTVSWRGNGIASIGSPSGLTAQYAPKVFGLASGPHLLVIRGREVNCQVGTITIAPTTLAAN